MWGAATLPGTSASMTGYRIRSGDGWWRHVESVRDMAGGDVYCDEARVWHREPFQTDESPSIDGYLATGDVPATWPSATDAAFTLPVVMEAETIRTRDEWANAVVLVHNWTDAATNTPRRIAAISSVSSGTYAPTSVGYKVQYLSRDVPITQAEANTAAAGILYRTQRRGFRRSLTLRSCWWLRRRNLHRFYTRGVDDYGRITRCTWQLDGSGLMTLVTRAPEPEAV